MKALLIALGWLVSVLVTPAWGHLSYVGSSTLGDHVVPEAARAFTAKTGIAFGAIRTDGSGRGLEAVRNGEAPLAGVSRPLTVAEKTQRLASVIVGYDVVAVFVHPTNRVGTLTREQLKGIYTGRIANWKQVGGGDAPIVCITQVWGGGRGLMVDFQGRVMDGAEYRPDRWELDRQSDQMAALRTERNGVATLSLAGAGPGMKVVAIDGLPATPQHVRSGAYLLSRPLLLVSQAPTSPEVKRFFDFMLSPDGQRIVGRRFVTIR